MRTLKSFALFLHSITVGYFYLNPYLKSVIIIGETTKCLRWLIFPTGLGMWQPMDIATFSEGGRWRREGGRVIQPKSGDREVSA